MTKIEEIVKELLENNIPVELKLKNDKICYVIGGFYKSGTVYLFENDNGDIFCLARYDEVNDIENIDDLISVNYQWWCRSKDRHDGWICPNDNWIPLLEKYNYITKEVKTVVTYK